MPPKNTRWQDLTWSWAYSTGQPASDLILDAAAQAAWPYAVLCAWTYLNDHDSAHDLMDHAVQNASDYLGRHSSAPVPKLIVRIKSVLRRRAKQLAAKRSRELPHGSPADLEKMYVGRQEIEQRVYTHELLSQLSPFANSIVHWRWLGYSWRKIAKQLDMDHTAVGRAYFRELESVVRSLSRQEFLHNAIESVAAIAGGGPFREMDCPAPPGTRFGRQDDHCRSLPRRILS